MKDNKIITITCYGMYRNFPAYQSFDIRIVKDVKLKENDPVIKSCIKQACKDMKVTKVLVQWELEIVDKKCAKKTQKKIPAKSKRGTVKRLKPRSSQK